MADATPEPPAPSGTSGEPVHAGAATLLPAATPDRPGRPRSFWALAGLVVVLLIAAIALPLALRGGSKAPVAPVARARAAGKVPTTAVFAQSDNTVPGDTAAVVVQAKALLAGALPAATLSSGVRAALIHPPASAATVSLTLGSDLSLADPKLPGCLASVTDGAALFGIDRIRYAGAVALLVVTADNDSASQASAYVLGPGCAQPGTGIRAFVSVPLS